MVGMPGIEPGLHEPESRVLPVYYIPPSANGGIVSEPPSRGYGATISILFFVLELQYLHDTNRCGTDKVCG